MLIDGLLIEGLLIGDKLPLAPVIETIEGDVLIGLIAGLIDLATLNDGLEIVVLNCSCL